MAPTGQPGMNLSVAHESIAKSASLAHLTNDDNQVKSAPPGAVKAVGTYRIPREEIQEVVALANLQDLLDVDQLNLYEEAGFRYDTPNSIDGDYSNPYGDAYIQLILEETIARNGDVNLDMFNAKAAED